MEEDIVYKLSLGNTVPTHCIQIDAGSLRHDGHASEQLFTQASSSSMQKREWPCQHLSASDRQSNFLKPQLEVAWIRRPAGDVTPYELSSGNWYQVSKKAVSESLEPTVPSITAAAFVAGLTAAS